MALLTTSAEQRRSDKVISEYEPVVPHCGNCAYYHPERLAKPAMELPYLRPMCDHNAFTPSRLGCCKFWKDKKTGETLN